MSNRDQRGNKLFPESPADIARYRIEHANSNESTSLNLSSLNLRELPESLRNLTRLQSLDVSGNLLKTLPSWLWNLRSLQKLRLSQNRLMELSDDVSVLSQLCSFDLSHNNLRTLPKSLSRMWRLQRLDLSHNKFAILPASFQQLTQLHTLNAHANRLSTIPESIGELGRLEVLRLNHNRLKSLPTSIGRLLRLRDLFLHKNQLACLPEVFGNLKQLRKLAINSNQLTMIPESLKRLPDLRALYLHDNDALGIPIEILGSTYEEVEGGSRQPKAPAQLLDYFFRTQQGRRPLNEVRVILVGRGGVGKTCIINRLLRDTFDSREPETPGIEIQPWEVTVGDEQVRLHMWDFGGQEILHGTHQLFLSERIIYVLVLTGREGQVTPDADYWLQLIRSFGGDSRVIIALNKSIQHPFDVNRGLLLEKYPNIVDFIKTDCSNIPGGGIPELKRMLFHEVKHLEHRKVGFPAGWFTIKERLARMSERQENYITWDHYQDICRELGEPDTNAQRDLAGFLHVLGIALNYHNDPRLKDTHVLNPRWVTEGIYPLLQASFRARGNALHSASTPPETDSQASVVQQSSRANASSPASGILTLADVAATLDATHHPKETHEFLLGLMEKFQLCFRLRNRNGEATQWLVPELLGENQPAAIRDLLAKPGLGFQYKYEVLPEGLLPRFIVQTHTLSEVMPELRWRTGVVLVRDGCKAVVRADPRECRIDIHISGSSPHRRGLLAIIRQNFDEQHHDLKGLAVDERIVVPGERNVTVGYRKLLSLEERGVELYEPEGIDKAISVTGLLNGVESKASRSDRSEKRLLTNDVHYEGAVDVFCSYSHKDEALRDQLDSHLAVLKQRGVIRGWHDRCITAGAEWSGEIDEHLEFASIILLLVSADFLASKYCTDVEVKRAMERHAAGAAVVIPVILRSVDWHAAAFGHLQALPKDAKPVTSWVNTDEAFTDVAKGIRAAVEQIAYA